MGRSYRLRLLLHYRGKLVRYFLLTFTFILKNEWRRSDCSWLSIMSAEPNNHNFPEQKPPTPFHILKEKIQGTKSGARKRNTRTRSSTNTRRTRRYQEPLGVEVVAECGRFPDFPFFPPPEEEAEAAQKQREGAKEEEQDGGVRQR